MTLEPTRNACIKALIRRVYAECIDQNWFLSLAYARLKYRVLRHNHTQRLHNSSGNRGRIVARLIRRTSSRPRDDAVIAKGDLTS